MFNSQELIYQNVSTTTLDASSGIREDNRSAWIDMLPEFSAVALGAEEASRQR
jgi:hypothetical protein